MQSEGAEPVSAAQPEMPHSFSAMELRDGMWQNLVPIIEVDFRHGKWWSIPTDMSAQIYGLYKSGQNAVYTWDWGDSREGTWRPDDEITSINRYIIDFETMEQKNLDTDRKRSVRIVWTIPPRIPQWTIHRVCG